MRLRVLSVFGSVRMAEIRRMDVQALADQLLAEGLNPSTIRCAVLRLRAIFRPRRQPGRTCRQSLRRA
jgi:hypothetical protein